MRVNRSANRAKKLKKRCRKHAERKYCKKTCGLCGAQTLDEAQIGAEDTEGNLWGALTRRRRRASPPPPSCPATEVKGKNDKIGQKLKEESEQRLPGCLLQPEPAFLDGCKLWNPPQIGTTTTDKILWSKCNKKCAATYDKDFDGKDMCKLGCSYMRCKTSSDKTAVEMRARGCQYRNVTTRPEGCKEGGSVWGAEDDFVNEIGLDEDAVCTIKACPPKCALQNVKVGEENVDQDVETDLQTMQKFGFVKKAVKVVAQWIKKKVCIPDATCLSANQKCQATLNKLHASLNQLTSELAAAAAKASAAKGSSAAAAAVAAKLDKQTAALNEVLAADTEAMEAAETEMTALGGQADQAAADAKSAKAALGTAVAKHAALVKVHQKSKQAALDAAAKAAGANSTAAKAAAAYKAAVAAHTDKAGEKAKVAAQLGM
jgi:hypothetical protein